MSRMPLLLLWSPNKLLRSRDRIFPTYRRGVTVWTMGRDKEEKPPTGKMSAAEFRVYNHMSEHMNMFHENFRATWKQLYQAASSGKAPMGMSPRTLMDVGETFIHHLTMHHDIEEAHIFPVLAAKMPAFQDGLEMKSQHQEIHKGLDQMGDYFTEVRDKKQEFRFDELKRIMDGFGGVLWKHLDAEVEQLGAQNMRKYWTLEEMRRMPM